MFKCFANNQTLSLKGLMDADQYFSSLKGFFAEEEEEKKKTHKLEPKKLILSLMCEWQIHMSREEARKKNKKIKCWSVGESLEIHLDIWSPSEGTWSKAKCTPKNENDFIMRGLSLDTDWMVGTISQAEMSH